MKTYGKILIAIDLSDESSTIIERALSLASDDSDVHVMYVQEPMDSVYMGVVPYGPLFVGMDNMEEQLKSELETKLDNICNGYDIAKDNRHLVHGQPTREIHHFSEAHDVDLIVMGTHGQKGVQLLLGSTANSVLHGSCCDVLAVRMGKT